MNTLTGTLVWDEMTDAQKLQCQKQFVERWVERGLPAMLERIRHTGLPDVPVRKRRREKSEILLEKKHKIILRDAKRLARLGLVEEAQKIMGEIKNEKIKN